MAKISKDLLIELYISSNKDSIINELEVQDITHSHQVNTHHYIIGKVSLAKLLQSGLNNRDEVFLAKWN